MHTLISPLFVFRDPKKKWYLNLNNYRNTHYQALNVCKRKFKEVMKSQIELMEEFKGAVEITYIIYPDTRRKFDIANPCAVIDKFLCDAITEFGKWQDDNYHIVRRVTYQMGTVDKQNPRCEIIIKDL